MKGDKMAAKLKYECPKCGVVIKVPKSSTAKSIKCEECGAGFLAVRAETRKKKTSIPLLIVFLLLAGGFYIYHVEEDKSLKSQTFEELAKGLIEQYREEYCKDLPITFKRFGGFRKESKDKYIAVVEVDYEKKMLADKTGKNGIDVVHKDLYFFFEIQDYGDNFLAEFSEETATVLEEIRKETENF